MRRLLMTVSLLLSFTAWVFAAEHPWQLKRNSAGIQVHVRKVDGSPLVEYRGSTVLDAEIGKVIALFEDVTRTPDWFYQCTQSRVLEEKGAGDDLFYFVMDMPWPVQDRDTVYRRIFKKDPGSGALEYATSSFDGAYPDQEGRIRMPMLKGLWRFTPLPGGRTEMYYQQHNDVGGHLPTLLINTLAVNIPFNSLSNFRKMLAEEPV